MTFTRSPDAYPSPLATSLFPGAPLVGEIDTRGTAVILPMELLRLVANQSAPSDPVTRSLGEPMPEPVYFVATPAVVILPTEPLLPIFVNQSAPSGPVVM